ncbi:MAG: hypothetical protein WEG36_07290 [Gemmatimonadota bacterium]
MILTVLDARSVQGYVFGSNRLRDNIGTSHLVRCALDADGWAHEAVKTQFEATPGAVQWDLTTPGLTMATRPELRAELFFAGGGNIALVFRTRDEAEDFARRYSRLLLTRAPGLRVECVHQEIAENLAEAMATALRNLTLRKAQPEVGLPTPGLGVTATCAITRTPANVIEDEEAISHQIEAARASSTLDDAASRFRDMVQEILASGEARLTADSAEVLSSPAKANVSFELPLQLDDLGRSEGDKSFIGVVHLDGNGIGGLFSELLTEGPRPPEDFVSATRDLSAAVDAAGSRAVEAALTWVVSRTAVSADGFFVADSVPLRTSRTGAVNLPLRFVVFGGDDITLVCDGRLALDLTAAMLQAFGSGPDGLELSACAGIALVKSHYPFARAYHLADSLCRSAKLAWKNAGRPKCGVMDWHLLDGGVEMSIKELRERKFAIPDGRLTLRPYAVGASPGGLEDWFRLREMIGAVQDPDGVWADRRSLLKDRLTGALRLGLAATEDQLQEWRETRALELPGGAWNQTGFGGGGTPYIDLLELMDFLPATSSTEVKP